MLQILGMEECQKRINKMVEQAKYEANVPLQKPLNALVSGATVVALLCLMLVKGVITVRYSKC
jgi:hypothetical protein